MPSPKRQLLSGDEAIALAARDAGVALGTGYPGTPSTEILERFSELGGPASGRPMKKWRWKWRIGAAFAGARAMALP
jgi:indolepyruvate ferredoxin oxidoreductase alpha subunit